MAILPVRRPTHHAPLSSPARLSPLRAAMAAAEAAALFASCGLEPKTAANVASNAKVSAALREMLADAGVLGGCDKSVGNLLYSAATRVRPAGAMLRRSTR